MRLNISDIVKQSGASLDIKFSENLLGLNELFEDVTFDGPVNFEGKLLNVSGILKLRGQISASYHTKCFRCLQNLKEEMSFEIQEDILDARSSTDSEAYTFEGYHFEIDKVIMDYIVINLPMRHECGSECKGLCLKCGNNLNTSSCVCSKEDTINPQMEALRDFFNS